MLWTIISLIVTGLIIGALARMVMPGHQNLSIAMTIVFGIIGSVVGGLIVSMLFNYNNANGGINWIGIIAGVITAVVAITLYGRLTGKQVTR